METFNTALLSVLPGAVVLFLLITFLRFWCFRKENHFSVEKGSRDDFKIPTLHGSKLQYRFDQSEMKRKPHFSWIDYPVLVSEAIKQGWGSFALGDYSTSLPRSVLWDFCTVCDHEKETDLKISWEISEESSELLQKIRFMAERKDGFTGHVRFSSVRAALPLPGPNFGDSTFPPVGYFEVTICHREDLSSTKTSMAHVEGEKKDEFDSEKNAADPCQQSAEIIGETISVELQERNFENRQRTKDDEALISLGLCGVHGNPFRLPGRFPGSIGFNSDGSVYLDGTKLILETSKSDWGGINTVIGCGFDPKQKKVFFTLDSEMVCVINCKSKEFEGPLFPTLSSNTKLLALVNLGQNKFKYAPANMQRTPNPCLLRQLSSRGEISWKYDYEETEELFSMGRLDADWLKLPEKIHAAIKGDSKACGMNFEGEVDDLFEIGLNDGQKSVDLNSDLHKLMVRKDKFVQDTETKDVKQSQKFSSVKGGNCVHPCTSPL